MSGAALGVAEAGLVSFETSNTRNAETVGNPRLEGERRQAKYQAKREENPFGKAGSYTRKSIDGEVLVIDPKLQRMARCRKSILNTSRLYTKRIAKEKRRYKVAFITLTYAKVTGWSPMDIAKFVKILRQWHAARKIPFLAVWKLEMQQRGAVHYHVMVWIPVKFQLPKPDKQGWWRHGATKIEKADNAYGYMAKYLGKDEIGMIPKGARMYGVIGLDGMERLEVRWWIVPKFVREAFPWDEPEHRPKRARGGGWRSALTGEVVYSEWQFGGVVRVTVGDVKAGFVRLSKTPRVEPVVLDRGELVPVIEQKRRQAAVEAQRQYDEDRVLWMLRRQGIAVY